MQLPADENPRIRGTKPQTYPLIRLRCDMVCRTPFAAEDFGHCQLKPQFPLSTSRRRNRTANRHRTQLSTLRASSASFSVSRSATRWRDSSRLPTNPSPSFHQTSPDPNTNTGMRASRARGTAGAHSSYAPHSGVGASHARADKPSNSYRSMPRRRALAKRQSGGRVQMKGARFPPASFYVAQV